MSDRGFGLLVFTAIIFVLSLIAYSISQGAKYYAEYELRMLNAGFAYCYDTPNGSRYWMPKERCLNYGINSEK